MKTGASVFLILTGFLVVTSTALAEDPIFPVGLIVVEDLRDFDNGWPFDLSPEALVDLRSKGMEVIHLNGIYELTHPFPMGKVVFDWVMEDVDTLKSRLARADSFGFLVYAGVRTFDDALRRWGHDPEGDPDYPYFRWEGISANRYSATVFRDSLDLWVSWVVDSLRSRLAEDDIRSLYRYFFWDEPFAKHVYYRTGTLDEWDDYWLNIWQYDDLTGLDTDSLSVGTLLKRKIEERDTLRSVSFNLCGWYSAQQDSLGTNLYNAPRGLCALKCDSIPNPPHQYSFDKFVFLYNTAIGDTGQIREWYCTPIDSIVAPAKAVNPTNPPPVHATQTQSFGACNPDSAVLRITIPEEYYELINLGILHEVKGFLHYVLYSFTEQSDHGPQKYANLLDDDFVPFDAPYEEYVYNRYHPHFTSPDSVQPFNPNDPVHDPFRNLPPRPVDTLEHKHLEHYYEWRYEPYARNYNGVAKINNQLHIIGTELLGLWRAPSVATIEADSPNIFLPEIVTLSPTTTSDVYLFFVNKDMRHNQMGCTLSVVKADLPANLQSAYILDLSERHLIERTVDISHITFHVTLGAGEGKLVRLMQGTEGGDAMIADPDIEFLLKSGGSVSVSPQYEFTEGDTIQLSATVYNLGFTPMKNLIVDFYYYHTDSLAGADTVTLPALSVSDTLPAKVRASFDWITKDSLISPHDMHVVLGPPEDAVSDRDNNNEANMTLLIHPEDYATAILGDPWDMTERESVSPGQLSTADIDSAKNLTETPDSISGVWEATTLSGTPEVYLHIPDSIDGSEFSQFSVRFIEFDPGAGVGGFLKASWLNTDMTSGADSTWYEYNQWHVKEFDFSTNISWDNKRVAALWLRPSPGADRLMRLAWAKLTTKKP